ncbi:MAG TPA: hypothetical protein VK054_14140, partial [Beutenbergiaceae bacterium]|nr:hypothetical protein [Beutenbergiaceae bacterium]
RACMDVKNRYQKHRRVLVESGTPLTVEATGTCRRLQALAVMGWPATVIAEHVGVTRETLRAITHGERHRVLRATAQAVMQVFGDLCMAVGPNPATATIAKRKGWVSTLAWDDIDDPNERPQGVAA